MSVKRDVYDPKQQDYRVEFAINVILRGATTTRRFDACFEMNDGNQVAAQIYRRALKNPRLMAALPRYLNLEMCKEDYEKVYCPSTTPVSRRRFQCEVWVSIDDETFDGPHPESLTCSVAQILHNSLVGTSSSGVKYEEVGVVTDQGKDEVDDACH